MRKIVFVASWLWVCLGVVVGRSLKSTTTTSTTPRNWITMEMEGGSLRLSTRPGMTSPSPAVTSQNGSDSGSHSAILRSVESGSGGGSGVSEGGVMMQGEGVGMGARDEIGGTLRGMAGSGGNCGSRFLPTSMSQNITQKCVDLIGFKLDNFPPKEEDLIKINYEDKCFSKCYLTELNYMTAADNFDAVRIMDEIRRETPPDKLPARIRATKECLKKTEEMATDEGGVPNSPCKFGLVFFSCARIAEKMMIC